MTAASPVPRRARSPRWLDLRLITGVVLVVVAILAGALVVSRANHTDPVWAANRDLAAGTVLRAGDLSTAQVRLSGAADHYERVTTSLVGQTLSRAVSAGELLPRGAVGSSTVGTRVTVPLDAQNAPPLQRGQRIRVWVSTKTCLATVVLGDVTVQDVDTGAGGAFSSGSGQDVVIRVPQSLADRLVSALDATSASLRAGILEGPEDASANSDLPSLSSCLSGS